MFSNPGRYFLVSHRRVFRTPLKIYKRTFCKTISTKKPIINISQDLKYRSVTLKSTVENKNVSLTRAEF